MNVDCNHKSDISRFEEYSQQLSENEERVSFCTICGAIVSSEKFYAIKPSNYIHKIELFSQELLPNITLSHSHSHESRELVNEFRQLGLKKLKSYQTKLKFSNTTYFYASIYFDKVISCKSISQDSVFKTVMQGSKDAFLHLVDILTLACFTLSAKFNEIDPDVPVLKKFCLISGSDDITVTSLQAWEVKTLKLLNYKLDYPNSYYILKMLLSNGIVFSHEFLNKNQYFSHENSKIHINRPRAKAKEKEPSFPSFHRKSFSNPDFQSTILIDQQEKSSEDFMQGKVTQIYSLCLEIHNLAFTENESTCYLPHYLAYAVVAFSRKMIKLKERWPKIFETLYTTKFEDFKPCYEFVKRAFKANRQSKKDPTHPDKQTTNINATNTNNSKKETQIIQEQNNITMNYYNIITTTGNLELNSYNDDFKRILSSINSKNYDAHRTDTDMTKIRLHANGNGSSKYNTLEDSFLTKEKMKEKISKLRITVNTHADFINDKDKEQEEIPPLDTETYDQVEELTKTTNQNKHYHKRSSSSLTKRQDAGLKHDLLRDKLNLNSTSNSSKSFNNFFSADNEKEKKIGLEKEKREESLERVLNYPSEVYRTKKIPVDSHNVVNKVIEYYNFVPKQRETTQDLDRREMRKNSDILEKTKKVVDRLGNRSNYSFLDLERNDSKSRFLNVVSEGKNVEEMNFDYSSNSSYTKEYKNSYNDSNHRSKINSSFPHHLQKSRSYQNTSVNYTTTYDNYHNNKASDEIIHSYSSNLNGYENHASKLYNESSVRSHHTSSLTNYSSKSVYTERVGTNEYHSRNIEKEYNKSSFSMLKNLPYKKVAGIKTNYDYSRGSSNQYHNFR